MSVAVGQSHLLSRKRVSKNTRCAQVELLSLALPSACPVDSNVLCVCTAWKPWFWDVKKRERSNKMGFINKLLIKLQFLLQPGNLVKHFYYIIKCFFFLQQIKNPQIQNYFFFKMNYFFLLVSRCVLISPACAEQQDFRSNERNQNQLSTHFSLMMNLQKQMSFSWSSS